MTDICSRCGQPLAMESSKEDYRRRFKRFSGLSRRQLGLFLVSAFSFIVSFSWNALAQNLFQTVIPSNVKNSKVILLLTQFLYALFITLVGAVTIAYVNSRPNRVRDSAEESNNRLNSCCSQIQQNLAEMKNVVVSNKK
jgi:hypothetical protein